MRTNDAPLLTLARLLRQAEYRFVPPTPETHRRILARTNSQPTRELTGVFGWSRPYLAGTLPMAVETLLADAEAVESVGPLRRSRVRFATLGDDLFLHSAYPTTGDDAVFFGPDTYRFVRFAREVLAPASHLVDVGAGSGAGGLALRDRADRVTLSDVNPRALAFARVNAVLAGGDVTICESDVLAGVPTGFDAVICNPPYLVDPLHRLYRDGQGPLGFALAVRVVREALARLPVGGQLVLYTGSPVVAGKHPLYQALRPELEGTTHVWEELDPDVFGEELDNLPYAQVDRIAAVGLAARKV